ncbi:MAG: PepSY-associated TM helix domain-containing protein [Pseudonocardiaceae bacterium]
MTTVAEFNGDKPSATQLVPQHRVTDRTAPGRFLRSVWRIHFYSAIFATPILIVMALSGLVIMYTEPITGWLYSDTTRVAAQGRAPLSLQVQQAAADQVTPDGAVLFRVATPQQPDRVSEFYYTAGSTAVPYYEHLPQDVTSVFVDPYTAQVTATGHPGDGIVGLANRMHGFLNNDSLKVALPSIPHLIAPSDNPDRLVDVPVGDLIIEIAMGWALVLALSGLYLWWPRRSQKGKTLLIPRLGKKGRLKWRDVHATSGILGMTMLIVFITTGMPWSEYWGPAWSAVGSTVTPGSSVDAPSTLAKAGDLDRFGHQISWAMLEDRVPASQPPEHLHEGGIHGGGAGPATTTVPAGMAARLSLGDVDRAAKLEGLKPGYAIVLPVNTTDDKGKPIYGSYQLSNAWPDRLSAEQTVYLDQFTGTKLAHSDTSSFGAIGQATELGVLTHMGTQFGVVDRVVMTAGVLLLLVSIGTSAVMWWLRRPGGGTGLPKRPTNPRLPAVLGVISLVVAVVYPLWGVSALVVVVLDRFLVRRVRRLRSVFGLSHKVSA